MPFYLFHFSAHYNIICLLHSVIQICIILMKTCMLRNPLLFSVLIQHEIPCNLQNNPISSLYLSNKFRNVSSIKLIRQLLSTYWTVPGKPAKHRKCVCQTEVNFNLMTINVTGRTSETTLETICHNHTSYQKFNLNDKLLCPI